MSDPMCDPFFRAMFAHMSPGAKYLFTAQQLDEIKRAFGARTWGSHAIDVRLTAPVLRHSYYLVLLAGKNRRRVAHARASVATKVALSLVGFALAVAVLAGVA
jgi:hypothetical protein